MYDAARKIDTLDRRRTARDSRSRIRRVQPTASAWSKATPEGFKLMTDIDPNEGIYNCSSKNLFALTDNADATTTLADVGQNIKNMK